MAKSTLTFLGIFFLITTVASIYNLNDLNHAIHSRDADAVINVLIGKYFHARDTVAVDYFHQFRSFLGMDITKNLEHPLEKLLVALTENKWDFYATEIYDGIYDQFGNSNYAPMDVFCTPYPEDINKIHIAYGKKYYADMEEDLMHEPDMNLRKSLLKFAEGRKIGTFEYNPAVIYESGYAKDDPRYYELLCTKDGNRFFAERLFSCLRYHDDRCINRLFVVLANHGMFESVMRAFERLYGQALQDMVNKYTIGPYRHALLMIIYKATN